MEQSIIIINPYCQHGKGWKRWLAVRDEVYQRLTENVIEIVLERGVHLNKTLQPVLKNESQTFLISAGGDGSVNCLVNYLMHEQKECLPKITLGAIGLGSSNDFLKPFDDHIRNIPVRLNFKENRIRHDVGVASYLDADNRPQQKYFIVNASIGVTAEANWQFNHPGPLLGSLKKISVPVSILYTAISTIIKAKSVPITLTYNSKKTTTAISNINILKVPYVSGSFYYNQPVSRDDGRLSINTCFEMSRMELLSVLSGLQKGRFVATDKTTSDFTQFISMKAKVPFVFEYDGETAKTHELKLSILPNALSVVKS